MTTFTYAMPSGVSGLSLRDGTQISSLTPGGTFTADSKYDAELRNMGCSKQVTFADDYYYAAPAAASAALVVASGAASNGTLSIAASPDVPRQLQAIFAPGTLAVTAGGLVINYTDSSGRSQSDTLSLITALSTTVTAKSTKGAAVVTSASIVGLVGGNSPTIEVGTNNVLGIPTGTPYVPGTLNVFKENVDGTNASTLGTTDATGEMYTPHTNPNGTHNFSLGASFNINV